jgi:hypothetical protein
LSDQQRIRAVKDGAEKTLFHIPGVIGVGIGHKHANGKYTKELSIKVYVLKKKPLAEVGPSEVIPSEIDGVITDVVETGPPERCASEDTTKYRPARGGTAIELQDVIDTRADQVGKVTVHTVTSRGTIGCFAQTTGNPSLIVGLTNHHITTFDDTLPFRKGKAVGQTSGEEYSICSKCCSEIIGVVLDGIDDLDVDVALIKLNRKLEYLNQVQDEPQNFLITGDYSLDTKGIPSSPFHVKKRGQKTRLTTGTVDSLTATFVNPHTHQIIHNNVIAIRPDSGLFNDKGDSGSVVVSNETSTQAVANGAGPGKVIGLLFGANLTTGFGFAFDIDIVKNKLAGISLPINILTATALDNKQTVPDTDAQADAYMVAVGDEARSESIAAENRVFSKLQTDLLQNEQWQRYLGLYQRHQPELRNLIDTNKRVAAAWRSNGGPAFVRSVANVVRSPEEVLPDELEGRPLQDCVNRIIRVLRRYASPALASDLSEFGEAIGLLGGRTYAQIVGG